MFVGKYLGNFLPAVVSHLSQIPWAPCLYVNRDNITGVIQLEELLPHSQHYSTDWTLASRRTEEHNQLQYRLDTEEHNQLQYRLDTSF